MGNDGGIVKDTQTGLMWMRCSYGQKWDGSTCMGNTKEIYWDKAMELKISYGGYDNWRLPTKSELESIVYCSDGNYVRLGREESGFICASNKDKVATQIPTIDLNYFPNTGASYRFWSSSPDTYSNNAWIVGFGYGGNSTDFKSNSRYVRLVLSRQ